MDCGLFHDPVSRPLRPYQADALARLRETVRVSKRVVFQLATGGGKTLCAAKIIEGARAKGKRVVFCVPAISLIQQTVDAFEAEGIAGIGVLQADHPRTDPLAPVQVASVQTLARRERPMADVVIWDECHVRSAAVEAWMADEPAKVFIGLSATPWAKGMGLVWQDLVVGATTRSLIDAGYLAPFRVFASGHPDLTGVKTVAGDYHQAQLGEAMGERRLVADIVSTWLMRGENRPTLCFAVDRAHAAKLQAEFHAAGVSCGYIDALTDRVERQLIQRRFASGEFKVVCNVGVLTTGVDWDVRCIILARPTKSKMLHCQIIGRALRTAPGKADALILDHADNNLRLGFVTDIHHNRLDRRRPGEKKDGDETERPAALPRECPKCSALKPPKTPVCPACGFKPERQSDIETEAGELVEITKTKKREATREEKQAFWSGLLAIAKQRGRKPGWASNSYREKFGVWPRGLDDRAAEPHAEVLSWVKAKDIRFAKGRGHRDAA